MLHNYLCDLLGIKYPIVQGGMAWLGTSELVAAVSAAGGLGTIGSGHAHPEWLKEQIRQVRELTDNPFAVNIMLMSPFLKDNLKVVLDEAVPVVTFGAGNPGNCIPALKEAGIKVIPVVSSVALAVRLDRQGVDTFVAEGMESGGHIGDTATFPLIPQIVDSVKSPVIAAGGVADGRGLAAALALGAQGVQMGTRFICSTECIAHIKFKEQIVQARDRSTVVTGVSTGHPVRCLMNRFTRHFAAMEKAGTPVEQLENLGRGSMYRGAIEGNVEDGSLMAGQVAGLIRDIKPVKDIIADIVTEAERVICAMNGSKYEECVR
ncbi:MAG: nitronate monooxygenase [Dehalococcoidia bacterium]|nr:nitronate monooxygenase [Dehalococcoidia bacterium]MDD5494905.1 nitronate monooxygenase [Dehalococcoidia bacterium]